MLVNYPMTFATSSNRCIATNTSATSAEQVITLLCRSPSNFIASGVEKCPFAIEVHPPAALSEVIRACENARFVS